MAKVTAISSLGFGISICQTAETTGVPVAVRVNPRNLTYSRFPKIFA